ncbi:saccharopine dehydrogenase (NADP+, L-glutamate forming) [Cohaesibacter sp. ES.047]|uniref:saccharopine dehydrogenase C-terminal domain-containing protein n=1 Tax=Cohaesibacter sp. ES.047 TaxID=1798205 RepID=UPI000BB98E1D|nr:saccharopine dehydrogenase C-terminal domain-containing protein [Cohaesibacter sp. ES.047]SNY93533.1 saccharopine dehydrogenase (NADP+, L-glutamate forming) [Cohaesibacter sp. ES.047]
MTNEKRRIHWLGAGLASVPGIRRLAVKGYPLHLWERDLDRARVAIRGLEDRVNLCLADEGALEKAVRAGDVVISMLPSAMHDETAKLCLGKDAHFISSSYTSPAMRAMNASAKAKGLSFVNEVGLDPGIDHLLAHLLIDDYRNSPEFDPQNAHDFQSYCGGFPAIANDFKYKFSWSPLGVLKALKSPARAILEGQTVDIARPWDAVEDYPVDLNGMSETFQSYPNRDSLPFMAHYGIDDSWNVERFVRGTLRLDGWADAWRDIFKSLEASDTTEDELKGLSDRLWADHAYQDGERDRVVLSVELKVTNQGETVWHKAKSIAACGTAKSSAMARLVSITMSLAAEALWRGQLDAGVITTPKDPATIRAWLETIAENGDLVHHTDYMAEERMIAAE